MALIVPVSGPYTGTYAPPTETSSPYYGQAIGAVSLGIMNDDGYRISCEFKAQEVNATDAFAMTLLDFVNRGQDWKIFMTGQEWKAALMLLLQPWGVTPFLPNNSGSVYTYSGVLSPQLGGGGTLGSNGAIGTRGVLSSGILLLTSTLGGPPTAPASLTANQAIISPNSRADFNFTSKVRELPLELSLLPYNLMVLGNNYTVPFSVT
jgi:hypothetical protein